MGWDPTQLKQYHNCIKHRYNYDDVIISAIASQITSLTIVYLTVHSDADKKKHQSSASLAFVWGIHRRPVNSPHKWPVTRKMFHFMTSSCPLQQNKQNLTFPQQNRNRQSTEVQLKRKVVRRHYEKLKTKQYITMHRADRSRQPLVSRVTIVNMEHETNNSLVTL